MLANVLMMLVNEFIILVSKFIKRDTGNQVAQKVDSTVQMFRLIAINLVLF